jgi:hypothetical protein
MAILKINVTEVSACLNVLDGHHCVVMMKMHVFICVVQCIHACCQAYNHVKIHHLQPYQHLLRMMIIILVTAVETSNLTLVKNVRN